MKFIHLSDLHLGKRLHEVNLLEDQAYILQEILTIVEQEAPQAVVIAGDIYDKSVPSGEAVQLFDLFLNGLAERGTVVFVLSGNHDSPERIAFGSKLMRTGGVYLSPVYQGTVLPVTLEDEFGPVNFYLLPFVKPAQVRRFFPDRPMDSYTDAMEAAGMPDGVYALGGQQVFVREGAARLASGVLAGSVLTMPVALHNMIHRFGIAPETAVRMYTLTPAQSIGEALAGRILPGSPAPLTMWDENWELSDVLG